VALQPVAPAPRAQQRLLDEVLRLLEVAEHAVAVDVELAAVALRPRGELRLGGRRWGHAGYDDAVTPNSSVSQQAGMAQPRSVGEPVRIAPDGRSHPCTRGR